MAVVKKIINSTWEIRLYELNEHGGGLAGDM